jgi:hypothetical protein
MILSLEIMLVVGVFVIILSGATLKLPSSLAWISDLGEEHGRFIA